MPRTGDVYQFRMWLKTEKKVLRKSLKTRDLNSAIELAEEKTFEVMNDLKSGKELFGITLKELTERYLAYRQLDVDSGYITPARLGTIRSQINALLRIKDGNLKLSELNANSLRHWRQMRNKDNHSVTIVTIRNETATINHMFRWGYPKYSHFPELKFEPIRMKKSDIGRRDVFTPSEYKDLYTFLGTYCSKKECPNEDIRWERLMVRDFILILSNTLMRVGELKQMKWSDVLKLTPATTELGRKVTLVSFKVRAETSKNRVSREVLTRGGEYFMRLKTNAKFTTPDDLLFTNKTGTHPLGQRELYKHWYAIMKGIGIDNHKTRKLSYYSLRHFGITTRIRAMESIFTIANTAGTSVGHIESHYGHIDKKMRKNAALKDIRMSWEDTESL